ncbi:MAG: hypothetical protein SH820_00710 [Xanthomonadales bacterium]|nr:hypothetical protein [Xanthomonadales bacterium]
MRSESLTPVADYRGAWVLEVEGAVSFFGHGGTGVISYQPVKPGEIHLVPFWFIHVVLPMYLSFMNGLHFFHAAAVEVEGEAMLIMAPSMGGKSTLAAHFLQMGHDLLADDKVMVRLEGERFWAATSHDRYRPYRKFEDLGVRAIRSAEKPLPIKAAILLQPEEPGTPIAVEPIPGRERFETLSAFTLFRTDDPTQGVIGPTGLMASRIPMYRVFIPRDLHQLPLVYQTIIEGLKRPSREPLSSMNC